MRLEPRWKILSAVVAGPKRVAGASGDDHIAVTTLPLWHGTALVAACADGAGSARFGSVGAELACRTAVRALKRLLRRRAQRHGLPSDDEMRMVNKAVHTALLREAERRQVSVRELATTLLLAVATPLGTVCSQIGDGVIVVQDAEGSRHVFWPDQGEYANTTHFASETPQVVRVATLPTIDGLALLTDGLQMLALDYAARRAHPPFFAGLFAELARAEPAALQAPLAQFLASPAVRARSDDDVSLLLALRAPA